MSSVFVVNQRAGEGLSFGVRALGSHSHGLAVFRNDELTLRMVLPASLFGFSCEGVRINLFDGDGVPRCAADRILFAVIFRSETAFDDITIRPFSRNRLLYS